ncbi:MAG TPA: hypothetical protein PKE63_08800 [Lacibacter sp.]|nr:hypothetical protein [Lacibacter sp.]
MKSILFALLFVFVTGAGAVAQKNKSYPYFLSVGPDLLIPDGEFDLTHSPGVGATAEIGWRTGRTLAPVAGYSWYSIPGKAGRSSLNAQVVRAGLRAYLGNLYLTGEAGNMFQSGYANGNAFVYMLGAGDEVRLSKRTRLDISGRYESFNAVRRVGIIGVRAAFTWKWGAF